MAVDTVQTIRENELEEARTLQRALIPKGPLRGPGFEVAHKIRPMDEVSGDFLDYFQLADQSLGLYVGDVVGKGLTAAMYAALAVGTLRGTHKTGQPPASVLDMLNRRLSARPVPGRFCAVQYAVFDPLTFEFHYSNAGLPRPLCISPKGCRELGGGGLPVGLFMDSRYELLRLTLNPGEAVLFATDGVLEAWNGTDEEFGMQRLIEVCWQHRSESPECLLESVFQAVDEFAAGARQRDDMTAAVLRVG